MEDIDQNMEDFIIAGGAYAASEIGKSRLTGDIVGGNACKAAVWSAPVFIAQHFTEAAHFFVAVDESEQVQQKQAWRVVTRRRYGGVTIGHQGANKWKVDQRGDHPAQATFDIAVWIDLYETLFKAVIGKQVQIRERILMRKRNIYIDLVEPFGYTGDGSPG